MEVLFSMKADQC